MSITNSSQKKFDFLYIAGLALLFVSLYYPVWYANYLYTDEAVHLWHYGKDPGFQMFSAQGRWITEKLMLKLFGSINSVAGVRSLRIFSFFGWLAAVPVWYFVMKDLFHKHELPASFAALSVAFLICLPSVSISVFWASCLELFIANTAGLLSGYFFYRSIRTVAHRVELASGLVWISALFGLVALFTYQNGFGFYCLPFLLHLLRKPSNKRYVWIGIGGFFLITIVYFLFFKLQIRSEQLEASARTRLNIAPWSKLKFFFSRPMSSAFHLTYLFNEKKLTGYVVYACVFIAWTFSFWLRSKQNLSKQRIVSYVMVLVLLSLSYFPSLLVQENYAPNRTTMALHVTVYVLLAESLFFYLRKPMLKTVVGISFSILFAVNAWYNTRKLFLQPVQTEYVQLHNYIVRHYGPATQAIHFIQPAEDFFVKQYGITRSWDEFGVPSTFFNWVPEFFARQIVFEKTGNRKLAGEIPIRQWASLQAFNDAFGHQAPNILLVEAEKMIMAAQRSSE